MKTYSKKDIRYVFGMYILNVDIMTFCHTRREIVIEQALKWGFVCNDLNTKDDFDCIEYLLS